MSWVVKAQDNKKKKGNQLRSKDMAAMISVFVDKQQPDDYKCKNCNMRVPDRGDKADCTIVQGGVSLGRGVCTFWAYGEESASKDDQSTMRMEHADAGYEETKAPTKSINCGTCDFYEETDAENGNCKLWMGGVSVGNCCMAYKNSENITP